MYRVALESLLGITVERGTTLRVRPCVPDGWPRYALHLRLPDGVTRYAIAVENPDGCAETVTAATVDGCVAPVRDGAAHVPLVRDGAAHRVTVTLGASRRRRVIPSPTRQS